MPYANFLLRCAGGKNAFNQSMKLFLRSGKSAPFLQNSIFSLHVRSINPKRKETCSDFFFRFRSPCKSIDSCACRERDGKAVPAFVPPYSKKNSVRREREREREREKSSFLLSSWPFCHHPHRALQLDHFLLLSPPCLAKRRGSF